MAIETPDDITLIKGDANGDKRLSVADVRKIILSIAKNEEYDNDTAWVYDVNSDKNISVADARKLVIILSNKE